VLRVQQLGPVLEWHETSAEFRDRTPLPVGHGIPAEPYDDKQTSLHHVSSDSEGNNYFLVGTESELAKVLKNRFDMHLGSVQRNS
jgi:hypothetical protein